MKREPTEMELRVARALRDLAYPIKKRLDVPCVADMEAARERFAPITDYLDEACAAIHAMREPTEDMLEEGNECGVDVAETSWRAMIDAASPPEGS